MDIKMDQFLHSSVVIDNGSGYMKVGFSSQQKKPYIFPSIIGRPKYDVVIPSTSNQFDAYMGQDLAGNKRALYKLKYPISHGIIDHWDDMQLLWKHAFSLLKIAPNECPVLLTQANLTGKKQRKKIQEIFFQKFKVPALYIATQGVLSLFATGRSTGIVLDSGDGVTHVVPVYQGYSLSHSCERINLGGRDVTSHLQNLLRKSGINLTTSAQFQIIKDIKEGYCKIKTGLQQKMSQKEQNYTLPDGEVVTFCNNEKDAGQILFSPDLVGLQCPSVVQLLCNSLNRIDMDLRTKIYSQIILSGGNTMFNGFPERFLRELKIMLPDKIKPRVLAAAHRNTMCWEGGSILASLPSFKNMCLTRKDFQDQREYISKKII